jgi:hypothetical protein
LELALGHAQRRHPALRTSIQRGENGYPLFVPSPKPIFLRVSARTNDRQWLEEVDTELALPFQALDISSDELERLLVRCREEGTTLQGGSSRLGSAVAARTAESSLPLAG